MSWHPVVVRIAARRVTVCDASDPDEHLQEDILDGVYRVVLYRHEVARCEDCGQWVQQPGEGEILGQPHRPVLA